MSVLHGLSQKGKKGERGKRKDCNEKGYGNGNVKERSLFSVMFGFSRVWIQSCFWKYQNKW